VRVWKVNDRALAIPNSSVSLVTISIHRSGYHRGVVGSTVLVERLNRNCQEQVLTDTPCHLTPIGVASRYVKEITAKFRPAQLQDLLK